MGPIPAPAPRAAVAELLHHSLLLVGLPRSRWWLDRLHQVVPWWAPCSLSGVCKLLRRPGLRYKRGHRHLHWPDPAYDAKLRVIALARHLADWNPARYGLLYEDELTSCRRPAVALSYAPSGPHAASPSKALAPIGAGASQVASRRRPDCMRAGTAATLAAGRLLPRAYSTPSDAVRLTDVCIDA